MNKITVLHHDGLVEYYADFLSRESAIRFYHLLADQLCWTQEHIRLFGKSHLSPRLIAWYGEAGIDYKYSGIHHYALPWTEALFALRQEVEGFCQASFNGVLCNWYRDGNDCMGWHSDDEKSLGAEPLIASLSLGSERRFVLQHKKNKEKIALTLQSGSLLLMKGQTQQHWRHTLPRSKSHLQGRINLTFRNIITP